MSGPHEPRNETQVAERDERDARDRELLDYLIDVTWAACIRGLRREREQGE